MDPVFERQGIAPRNINGLIGSHKYGGNSEVEHLNDHTSQLREDLLDWNRKVGCQNMLVERVNGGNQGEDNLGEKETFE